MPSKFLSGETTNKYDHVARGDVVDTMYAITNEFETTKKDIQNIKSEINDNKREAYQRYSDLRATVEHSFQLQDSKISAFKNGIQQIMFEWIPIVLTLMLSPFGSFINYFLKAYIIELEYTTSIQNNDTPYLRIRWIGHYISYEKYSFQRDRRRFKAQLKNCNMSKRDIIRNTLMQYMKQI